MFQKYSSNLSKLSLKNEIRNKIKIINNLLQNSQKLCRQMMFCFIKIGKYHQKHSINDTI